MIKPTVPTIDGGNLTTQSWSSEDGGVVWQRNLAEKVSKTSEKSKQ